MKKLTVEVSGGFNSGIFGTEHKTVLKINNLLIPINNIGLEELESSSTFPSGKLETKSFTLLVPDYLILILDSIKLHEYKVQQCLEHGSRYNDIFRDEYIEDINNRKIISGFFNQYFEMYFNLER